MSQYNSSILRKAQREDIPEMQQIFVDTIRAVCKEDYTPEQIHAWLSGINDDQRWNDLVDRQFCVVAQRETIIGFGSLAHGSYVDFIYIHRNYLRQGVASLLMAALLAEAARQGTLKVSAYVSKTARPFFEHQGFSVVEENKKILRGVEISNFTMTRPRIPEAPELENSSRI